jgi:cAMP-binding proteins - catabolite gene activator and regulatory subunit of cAMP-dependent protein kinases
MGIEKLLSRKQVIFCNGQSASHIYKIEFGCICTYVKRSDGSRLIIGFYFPGDYFGLELRKKHLVSAEPITPSLVLVIRRRALAALAANDLAVARHMLAITNAELQRAQNHSLLLRNSASAHKRVANFLFEMKQRNRRKEVELAMSRQDIADYLSLTIETVSRSLNKLKKKSAISHVTIRSVTVHLRKRLAA